jgi:hypothetical protein
MMMTKDHEAIVHVIRVALDHHEWRLVRHLTRLIEMLDANDAEQLEQPSFLMRSQRNDHHVND